MQYAFEKLAIWHLGMRIVTETYAITKKFPRDELFGITSQMRRASLSIPLNIAEGSSRKSKKDFALFLRRAIGSNIELVTALRAALSLQYLTAQETEGLEASLQEEYFKIVAFEKKLLRE